jgi:hypothetical protein
LRRSRTSPAASSIAASAASISPWPIASTVEEGGHRRPASDRRQARGARRSGGVGLTPHTVAIERAWPVAAVNETIDKMGSTGELKALTAPSKTPERSIPASGISTISMRGKRRCWRRWRGRRRNNRCRYWNQAHDAPVALDRTQRRDPMPRKSAVEEGAKGSKPTQAKDQSHKPAKHIEETARLASSVEPNKDPEKVRKAKD